MKPVNRICLLMAVVLFVAVCFNGCSTREAEVAEVPTGIPTEALTETREPTEAPTYPMPVYTEEEIQAAMEVVTAKFNKDFTGCELLRLEYIEGKYPSDYEHYAKRCGVDRVIVLESDFYAGPDAASSLNQDHAYHNWKWILIDDGSGWTVWTNGYG